MKNSSLIAFFVLALGNPHIAFGISRNERPLFNGLATFENPSESYYQAGQVIRADLNGNIFIGGWFAQTVDFDPGPGQDLHTAAGAWDGFVTRINANGSYGWTKVFGGSSRDLVTYLTVDHSGNMLITGYFSGVVDFDPGPGQDFHTSNGDDDVFLTKLDNDGSYQWTRTFGGSDHEIGRGIAVNNNGDIMVTGQFGDVVDFDPGPGQDFHTSAGGFDIFFTKYSSKGSYQWTRTLGGASLDSAERLAIDAAGDIIIAGSFRLTVDFDPGPGEDLRTHHHPSSVSSSDLFLAKYKGVDGSYLWAYTAGPEQGEISNSAQAADLVLDTNGNIYATGWFSGTVDFDPGPDQDLRISHHAFLVDEFVVHLQSNGSYQWTKNVGPAASLAIAMDSSGILVTGNFVTAVDFDPGPGQDTRVPEGRLANLFVTKLYFDGSYAWTYNVGSNESGEAGYGTVGFGVCITPGGKIFSTGYYSGPEIDFDAGSGQTLRQTSGPLDLDIFVLKLGVKRRPRR